MKAYQIGIDQVTLEGGRSFLMAIPEKALCDKVDQDRGTAVRSQTEIRSYLEVSLRVDPEALRNLNVDVILEIAERYRSRKIKLLGGVIRQLAVKEKHRE
jgi:hypothetical protein